MGQTLSEPVVEKHTQYGEDDWLAYGVSEMQGWRLTMEDAHATVLDLDADAPGGGEGGGGASGGGGTEEEGGDGASGSKENDKRGPGPRGKNSFFAVYDGHGGSSVARFSGDTVHHRLRSLDEYRGKDYQAALKRAFLATDEDLRSNPDFINDPSGCTAVAALLTDDGRIMVANAGDSRSVLSVNGNAKAMSYDHKPINRSENSRIIAAGGFVEFGRVNGNLALSRAIGDFEFKRNTALPPEQQIVTADPDIEVHEITPEDEFLVIACDGIWDVLSNQQVVDWVRRALAERKSLQDIAEQMLDRCLAPDCDWGGVGCDNMTLMVIALFGNRTKEEWYDTIAERVEKGEGYATPYVQSDPFESGRRGLPSPAAPQRATISSVGLPENLVNALRATGMLFADDPDENGNVPGETGVVINWNAAKGNAGNAAGSYDASTKPTQDRSTSPSDLDTLMDTTPPRTSYSPANTNTATTTATE